MHVSIMILVFEKIYHRGHYPPIWFLRSHLGGQIILIAYKHRNGCLNRGKRPWWIHFQSFFLENLTPVITIAPFWPPSGHFGGHIILMEHSYHHGYRNRGKSAWRFHFYYFYVSKRSFWRSFIVFWKLFDIWPKNWFF